jgi:putative FmdB family regulatory protein
VPVYTYTCTNCGETIERRQSFSDAPLTTCEQCSGALRKVIHPVGIVFKGSGWYVTDSRSATNGTAAPKADHGDATEAKKDAGESKASEAGSDAGGTSEAASPKDTPASASATPAAAGAEKSS